MGDNNLCDSLLRAMDPRFIPDSIVKASRVTGVPCAEIFKRAAEAYESRMAEELAAIISVSREGGSMEKLSQMEKLSVLPLGFLALTLPFAAMGGYGLAKNTWGGVKDVASGKFGSAARRVPAMAMDAAMMVPVAGKAVAIPKLFKAFKAAKASGKLGKGVKAWYGSTQVIRNKAKIAKMQVAAQGLDAGKRSMWSPSTWFASKEGLKAKAVGLRDKSLKLDEHRRLVERELKDVWGRRAANMEQVAKSIPLGKTFGWNKGAKPSSMTKAYSIFESPTARNIELHGNNLFNMSAYPSLVGLGLGTAGMAHPSLSGLAKAGDRINKVLDYRGPEQGEQYIPDVEPFGFMDGYTQHQ